MVRRAMVAVIVAVVAAAGVNVAVVGGVSADEGVAKASKAKKKSTKGAKLLQVDTKKSSIEFVGAKVTGDHEGGFEKWDGTAVIGPDGELQKLSFEVDTRSVYTDNEKLTGHLKSADFFHVEKFPKATFQSSKIEKIDSKDATHKITGVLNLHGVIKKIAFPATIVRDAGQIEAKTEFILDRYDFDITYKGMADDLIKKEVLMKIGLVVPTKS